MVIAISVLTSGLTSFVFIELLGDGPQLGNVNLLSRRIQRQETVSENFKNKMKVLEEKVNVLRADVNSANLNLSNKIQQGISLQEQQSAIENKSQWKIFEDKELGFKFQYPAELLGEFKLEKFENEMMSQWLKGSFSKSEMSFMVGGVNKNFSAPRGTGFTDNRGFITKRGEYFFLTSENNGLGSEVAFEKNQKVELLQGKNTQVLWVGRRDCTKDTALSPSYPGCNFIGAIINLKHSVFSGLAFTAHENYENLLKEMVKTFEVKS